MAKYYSYRSKIQDRKRKRSAFILIILTLGIVASVFFYGIPAMIRFAVFIADIKKGADVASSDDTIAPTVPRTDPIADHTNKNTLEVRGYTESGAIVTIYVNNNNEETVANNEGDFIFKIHLVEGVNTISLVAKDSSGNESPRSKTQSVVYDKTPPPLDITSPSDGQTFYGDDGNNPEIIGSTDPDIKVYVNERLSSSDDEGGFKIRTYLSEGENTITVKAVDNAQNETEKTLTVTFYP